jgi:putative oxidoreductase
MQYIQTIINIAFIAGRVIAGGFFLMNGFNHFMQFGMLTGYAKSKGAPAPGLVVGGSGVILLLGGLSLLLGFHPTIGAAVLVIFLLGASFAIHNFWTVQDPQAKMGEMINFLKNMALVGFLLMTLLIPRPWPMSLGH